MDKTDKDDSRLILTNGLDDLLGCSIPSYDKDGYISIIDISHSWNDALNSYLSDLRTSPKLIFPIVLLRPDGHILSIFLANEVSERSQVEVFLQETLSMLS